MERTVQGKFFFDPEDRIYRDHFPGNPIVPGSLMVHAFMVACEREGIPVGHCSLRNFRFRVFIAPGEYDYKMSVVSDVVTCALYDGAKKVATGTLTL